jgi:succinoglycan biosynthesis protein ExoH
MNLDSGIRARIAFLRFVMIFGVVVLHTPQYVPMNAIGSGWFDLIKAYFQLAVFRATVPVLTVISGFLLFNAALDQAPAKLFRKKARTILLPFLVFNLPLLPLVLAGQLYAGLETSSPLWPFEPMAWLDAAFGLTASPVNYPLNFLRDLLVLILLAPLFGWLLRRFAWPGLVLVTAVFMSNLDGQFLLRDVMAVLFYIGGMAAVRGWNLRMFDRYALACLLLFLLACAAIVYFRVANTTYLRLAAPFLIWPATVLLASGQAGRWLAGMSKYSFFLFLAHAPVLMLTWILYQRFGAAIPYPVYWVMAPLLVTAIVIGVYLLLDAAMPRVFRQLIGAGDRPPQAAHAANAVPGPRAVRQ